MTELEQILHEFKNIEGIGRLSILPNLVVRMGNTSSIDHIIKPVVNLLSQQRLIGFCGTKEYLKYQTTYSEGLDDFKDIAKLDRLIHDAEHFRPFQGVIAVDMSALLSGNAACLDLFLAYLHDCNKQSYLILYYDDDSLKNIATLKKMLQQYLFTREIALESISRDSTDSYLRKSFDYLRVLVKENALSKVVDYAQVAQLNEEEIEQFSKKMAYTLLSQGGETMMTAAFVEQYI
ncbi:MAG: hypothetical protein RSA71_06500 [Eubacterium sp.]